MNSSRTRRLPWVLAPALLVTAAWWSLRASVPDPDAATTEALEAAADEWWRHGDPDRTIPEDEWPPALRRLGPKDVRVTPQGVFIPFGKQFVEEWGLFVLPKGSDYRPQQNGDPSFRLLRGRVYEYRTRG